MAALSERGYSVLSLSQFMEWLKGAPLPARPAALLTFDGCYSDNVVHRGHLSASFARDIAFLVEVEDSSSYDTTSQAVLSAVPSRNASPQ